MAIQICALFPATVLALPQFDPLDPLGQEEKYFIDAQTQCDPTPPPFIQLPRRISGPWKNSPPLLPIVARDLPVFPLRSATPLPTIENQQNPLLDEDSLDRRHFWNMLVTIVPQSPFHPPPGTTLRILDVGCGRAEDAMPLHTYFGKSPPGRPGTNVAYLGIDIDANEIRKARTINPTRPDLKLLVADATAFNNFSELRGQFDVMVIRHQAVGMHPALWTMIFKETLDHLAKDGIILITSSSCFEHQIAVAKLKALGAKVQLSGQNPFARRVADGEKVGIPFRDHYVAILTQ